MQKNKTPPVARDSRSALASWLPPDKASCLLRKKTTPILKANGISTIYTNSESSVLNNVFFTNDCKLSRGVRHIENNHNCNYFRQEDSIGHAFMERQINNFYTVL